jgi:HEAT repeat protein
VREAAVEALGAKDRASAGAGLLRMLAEDPHPYVRAAAATAIGRVKAEGAFEALARLLEEDSHNDRLRCGALDGLRHLGDPRGAALAERFLPYDWGKGANHVVRETALRTRCALGAEDRRLDEVVLPLLDDPYHRMRVWAAEMAGTYGLEAATPRLKKMAEEDWDGGSKAAAKTALERLEKARAPK